MGADEEIGIAEEVYMVRNLNKRHENWSWQDSDMQFRDKEKEGKNHLPIPIKRDYLRQWIPLFQTLHQLLVVAQRPMPFLASIEYDNQSPMRRTYVRRRNVEIPPKRKFSEHLHERSGVPGGDAPEIGGLVPNRGSLAVEIHLVVRGFRGKRT